MPSFFARFGGGVVMALIHFAACSEPRFKATLSGPALNWSWPSWTESWVSDGMDTRCLKLLRPSPIARTMRSGGSSKTLQRADWLAHWQMQMVSRPIDLLQFVIRKVYALIAGPASNLSNVTNSVSNEVIPLRSKFIFCGQVLPVFLMACGCIVHAQITELRHVTVIDGNGGAPKKDATLVIDRSRVRAIVSSSVPALRGATVIDLTGKTIMPEIVNCHGHLGLVKGTKMSATNYTEENVRRQLLQYQDYGVGAVMVMGTDRDEAYEWREQSHAGKLPGALLYTAGRGFGVPGGLPPMGMGADEVYRPESAAEARQDVRELAHRTAPAIASEPDESPKVSVDPDKNSDRIVVMGKDKEGPGELQRPDLVKIWVDDFWGQYPKMKPEIYAAIIDEAHKHRLRVAAHVYHEEDAQQLVDDGIDVLAHSVRDAEIPDALVAEMKRKHVAYIGTLSLDDFATAYADDPSWLNDPFFRDALEPGVYEMITSAKYKQSVKDDKKTPAELAALPVALKNLKKVYDAGLLVGLGTDSGATPIRPFGFAEHEELQLLVRAGLSPLEAITVGTKNGAELLRAATEFGVLRPGLKANFIVLDKDPSEDIRNTESISAVWKDGKKVSDGPHAR